MSEAVIKVKGRAAPRERFKSFWRCGIEWPDAVDGKIVEVTPAQLAILKAEPLLWIEVLEPERKR